MLTLLLALALSQPAAVGSVTPTEHPQRFVVTFATDPTAIRWEFHRCPALAPCTLLARGPGSQRGATLDEANGRVGDSYVVSVYRDASVERVTLGTIESTRYWALLSEVVKE